MEFPGRARKLNRKARGFKAARARVQPLHQGIDIPSPKDAEALCDLIEQLYDTTGLPPLGLAAANKLLGNASRKTML